MTDAEATRRRWRPRRTRTSGLNGRRGRTAFDVDGYEGWRHCASRGRAWSPGKLAGGEDSTRRCDFAFLLTVAGNRAGYLPQSPGGAGAVTSSCLRASAPMGSPTAGPQPSEQALELVIPWLVGILSAPRSCAGDAISPAGSPAHRNVALLFRTVDWMLRRLPRRSRMK